MLELKTWYRQRLATRIQALEEAKARLKEPSLETVDSVRRMAHSLRGSGATYGFPEITEVARVLEEASDEDLSRKVDALLSALKNAATSRDAERATILVVEDDPDQAHLYRTVLGAPGREVLVAATAAQAESILAEKEVSLILLDLILPDTDGRNLLVRLRERLSLAGVPIVVVTVKGAAQARAECLSLGADDYLEKPVDPAVLETAASLWLRQGSVVARDFRRDPLTGLPNRAAFVEAFRRSRCGCAGDEAPSLAVVDIDNLREVNEEAGRAMGDQLVRRSAAVISRTLRGGDFVARWSGGEFALLFPKTDPEGAARALQQALDAMHGETFRAGPRTAVRLTFSAGVTAVDDHMTVGQAIEEAERFLYRAKALGRDRVISVLDRADAPRKKILLAEDDEVVRTMLLHLLVREGFQVVAFPNGSQALAAALDDRFSLVVSDGNMPKMDGFELVSRLRSLPTYAQVPIIMLTSMGREEDVVRGYERGADDYVLKPFSTGELMSRVRRLVKRP